MPDSNPLYELIGGYYPGDPIPRRPTPRGNYPERYYLNSDDLIDEYLYLFEEELERLHKNNPWKEFVTDDIRRALTAQVRPKRATYDPMRALELGDEEDVAGLQFKVELNPIAWIQDPADMAKKTVRGWVGDFLEWSDIDEYVERNEVWKPLLSGKPDVPAPIEAIYGEHIEEGVPPTGFKPFQLRELNITSTKSEKFPSLEVKPGADKASEYKFIQRDLFDKTANEFQSFNRQARSMSTRNSSFRKLSNSALQAAAFELEDLKKAGLIDPADLPVVEDFQRRVRILNLANEQVSKRSIPAETYRFGEKEDIIRTLGSRGIPDPEQRAAELIKKGVEREEVSGIGYSMAKLSSDLAKHEFGHYKGEVKKSDTTGEVVETIPPKVKLRENFDQVVVENRKKIEKAIEEARENLKGAAAKEAEFNADVRPLERFLNKLEGLEKKYKNKDLSDVFTAGKLRGDLDLYADMFATDSPIKGGLDRMTRKTVESHLLNGDIRDVIFKNRDVIGSKNILNVMDEALAFYKREDFYELVDRLEREGLLGVAADIFWNLLRKKLNGFTPRTFLQEGMKRLQYFGLVYDEDYDTGKGLINKMINSSRIFETRFTIDVEIDGKIKKFNFAGDKRWKHGVDAVKRTSEKLPSDATNFFTDKEFLEYLNNELFDSKQLREALLEHNVFLGLEMKGGKIAETSENIKKLKAVFKGMWEKEDKLTVLSIFKNRAGILEKFSEAASEFRDAILKRFGKYIAPVAYVRNILSKKGAKALARRLRNSAVVKRIASSRAAKVVAKFLTKALGAIVSVGTEGIGALVWPIIEKAIQYAINKVVDFGKKIVDAVRKGDLSIVSDFIDTGIKTVFKVTGCMVGCCSVPFGLLITTVIIMLVAITPVDPTRMTNVPEGGTVSPEGGGGSSVACPPSVCPSRAGPACFEFLDEASWPPALLTLVENAANTLSSRGGGYTSRLCDLRPGETIYIMYDPVGDGVGLHRPDIGGFRFGRDSMNIIGWEQEYWDYLFAHETAHVYQFRSGGVLAPEINGIDFDDAYRNEGSLPTYGNDWTGCGCCNSVSVGEDFAETVGNYIAINNRECSLDKKYNSPIPVGDATAFWDRYPMHHDFAIAIFN